MPSIRFTKSSIAELPAPHGTDVYSDQQLPNLRLRVGKRAKVYYCVCSFAGKKHWVKIGDARLISPEQARKEALKIMGQAVAGLHPKRKTEHNHTPTVQTALDDLLKLRDLKPSSVRSYEDRMSYLKPWLPLSVCDVTEDMVVAKLTRLRERKLSGATIRSVFVHARSVFNFARNRYVDENGKPLLDRNPIDVLGRLQIMPKAATRRTRIHAADLPVFLACLDKLEKDQPVMVDLVRLWLLTGMRNKEGRLLRKANIRSQTNTLYVSDTKNRLDLALPITDHMKAIIDRRLAFTDNEWLFPSLTRRGAVVSDVRPVQAFTEKEAGITWTPHDLRRTFISVGAGMGLRDIAKMVANHRMPTDDITAQYMSWNTSELRGLLTRIQDVILGVNRKSEPTVPAP